MKHVTADSDDLSVNGVTEERCKCRMAEKNCPSFTMLPRSGTARFCATHMRTGVQGVTIVDITVDGQYPVLVV